MRWPRRSTTSSTMPSRPPTGSGCTTSGRRWSRRPRSPRCSSVRPSTSRGRCARCGPAPTSRRSWWRSTAWRTRATASCATRSPRCSPTASTRWSSCAGRTSTSPSSRPSTPARRSPTSSRASRSSAGDHPVNRGRSRPAARVRLLVTNERTRPAGTEDPPERTGMSHVDLHLHLLPGVDDGARNERESIEHAARMTRDGVHEAVVTPHIGHPAFPVAIDEIAPRTAALQAALNRAGVRLTLHPGGEIHPDVAAALSAAELRLIAQGPAGSRWVLAEVPFAGVDEAFLAGCRAIRRHGFGLVIAHPERAAGLLDGGLAMLRDELHAGAVLQVNVCSLLGRNGDEARFAAQRLIRARLAYVLASDGHPGTRVDTLASGVPAAQAAGASPVQAWQLTESNPRFLLRHGLPVGPGLPVRAWRSPREASLSAARDAAQRLTRAR